MRRHRNALLVVLGGFVLFVAALLGGDARSAGADARLIAFTRADGIYLIRADGTGERALRRGGVAAGVVDLAWSPDGRRLAFTTEVGDLWSMDATGHHLTRLVSPEQDLLRARGLSWSPHGRRIAFTAWPYTGCCADLWITAADGKRTHRLLRTPGRVEWEVDWSASGNRIVFTVAGYLMPSLYVMNLDGKRVRAMSIGPRVEVAMPHWSPQGNRLALVSWPSSAPSLPWEEGKPPSPVHGAEIWVTDVSGHNPRQLTDNTVVDSNPAWSADGKKIVFLRGRDPDLLFGPPEKSPSGAEIYVMNADGSGVTRLTHDELGEGSPAWQPRPSS